MPRSALGSGQLAATICSSERGTRASVARSRAEQPILVCSFRGVLRLGCGRRDRAPSFCDDTSRCPRPPELPPPAIRSAVAVNARRGGFRGSACLSIVAAADAPLLRSERPASGRSTRGPLGAEPELAVQESHPLTLVGHGKCTFGAEVAPECRPTAKRRTEPALRILTEMPHNARRSLVGRVTPVSVCRDRGRR